MAFPAWMSGFCPAMFRATFDCPGSSDTVRFFTTMVGLRLASIGFFSGDFRNQLPLGDLSFPDLLMKFGGFSN
ncbi:unnamed protein product [Arabidopsis thaliana]|uniref:Uncharacterized protein n=1 Tax=Arabidopsis thaliana TaxID=3702 RepID=A0A654EFD1_ARATH|nr:unnamed protein product [Arabidopsis thaliana]